MTSSAQGTRQPKKRGRPLGSRNNATIVRMLAQEMIEMQSAEGPRQVSIAEALLLTLRHKAMGGDIRASKRLDKLMEHLQPPPLHDIGLLLVPGPVSQAEWIRRANIENQSRKPPAELSGDLKTPPTSSRAIDQPIQQPGPKSPARTLEPGPAGQPRLIR